MKFQTMDQRYLSERKAISEKYGPRELWSVIDHWPLYCGVANLSRFMAIADILRGTLGVPGDVAEFGSWRGANLLFMAKLLRIYDPHGSKIVHCFDSFAGLTEFVGADANATRFKDQYKGSLEELKDLIGLCELADEIAVHQGVIEETLPRLLDENKALTFSLIYCDTDLYQSTSAILQNLHGRLAKGGVFVFDEWNSEDFQGEGVAVNEFLQEFGACYEVESVAHARQPTLLIRKIKM
jgi:SAM-dependent methyltransferase